MPEILTKDYEPVWIIDKKFKEDIMSQIKDLPYNDILTISHVLDETEMTHSRLTSVVNILGRLPYFKIANILNNINKYIKQK